MFETVLHAGPPYYVGHLYYNSLSPDSSSSSSSSCSTKNSLKQYPLQAWWNQQQQQEEEEQQQQQNRKKDPSKAAATSTAAAVLGTLLRIADYRRMSDGRLLLLVQALERFVVTHVHQTLPYSIADVQLLPDIEELTQASSLQSYIDTVPENCIAQVDDDDEYWLSSPSAATAAATGSRGRRGAQHIVASELITQPVRSMSLLESFQRWHRYEFENTMLPLPLETDLSMEQVGSSLGSSLAQVLPYAPYSAVIDVDRLLTEVLPGVQDIMQHCEYNSDSDISSSTSSSSFNNNNKQSASTTPSLESRLLQAGILQKPSNLRTELQHLSCDELEIRLWNALNDFLKSSRKAVSPVLFGLLPPDYQDWPKQFVLERIATAIGEQTVLDHRYVRVSPHYPAVRRQKRLSFAAAALLEQQVESCQKLRAHLLAMPSTRDRLALVLQMFLEQVESFQ